jgi:hypothetical protein
LLLAWAFGQSQGKLVEQVEAELQARAVTARQLQEEAATAKTLAGLHKEQADATNG